MATAKTTDDYCVISIVLTYCATIMAMNIVSLRFSRVVKSVLSRKGWKLAHSVQYKTTKQYASKKLLDKTRWCQKVYDLSLIVFYVLGQSLKAAISQYLYEVAPSNWGRSLLKPLTKNASDNVVWLVVAGFLCNVHQTPCVVIEKKGTKLSVASSDFLWDFESHQLGEGWLGVGHFVPHPQHLFIVWFGRGLGATEKVFTVASRETCKVLLFHFCTGAKDGRGDSHLVSTQTHDFKDFLDCPKHGSQDKTTGVCGQSVDAEVAADVDLEMLGEVHKKNVDEKLRIVERGNVVGQAVGSSVLSPDNLPPVLGEEAGDGATKAAEGNAATAEPDHQWDRVGRCGDVAVELLVRNGRLQTHH